jgi:cbb3-type cytochrome c oxidase subunit III
MLRHILTVVFVCLSGFTISDLSDANEDLAASLNPEPFTVSTIKRGKQLFTMHCVTCHGTDGRGDTEMREFLKTSPSDLTDGQWIYGQRPDQIFDVIAEGRIPRDMPAFRDKLSEERIWQIINYLEFLGGRKP